MKCIALLYVLAELWSSRASAEASIDFEEVIKAFRHQEDGLKSVVVRGFETYTENAGAPGQWKRGVWANKGDAWINGTLDGPARVFFKEYVSEWVNGAAPTITCSRDYSFDGKEGREVYLSKGAGPDLFPVLTAEVRPEPPLMVHTRYTTYSTGTGFHLAFLRFEKWKASEYLRLLLDKKVPFDARWEKYGSDPCLRITRETFVHARGKAVPAGTNFYWFDPSRGYAFRGRQVWVPEGGKLGQPLSLQQREDVSELREAAPGLWYPTRASEECYVMKPFSKVYYSAESVVINDPSVTADSYRSPFPRGTRVVDHTTDELRIVGGTPSEMANLIDGRLDGGKAEVARRKQIAALKYGPQREVGQTGWDRWKWTGVTVVLAAGFALLLGWLHRRSRVGRSSAALLMLGVVLWPCFGSLGAMEPAGSISLPSSSSSERVARPPVLRSDDFALNSGFNSSYIAFRLLRQSVDPDVLSRSLGLDDRMSREASVEDIRQGLEHLGMVVRPGTVKDPAALLEAVRKDGAIAILRVPRLVMGADIGHYVVLYRDDAGIERLDFPGEATTIDRDAVVASARIRPFGGEALLVTEVREPATQPVLQFPNVVRAPRPFAFGESVVTLDLRWSNPTREPVEIVASEGCCSCFSHLSGDTKLEPGTSGLLVVHMNRPKLNAGPNHRFVTLHTSSASAKEVKVPLEFEIQPEDPAKDIRVAPVVINLGRTSNLQEIQKLPSIRVLVPKAVTISKVEAHVSGKAVECSVIPPSGDAASADRPKRSYSVQLQWLSDAATIDSVVEIEVSMTDGKVQHFAVPLKVELVR